MKEVLDSPNTIKLDIPVRLQWENHHGYCGQTATQSCSLYYGNYISQLQARKVAGSELLIGQNDEKFFDKLGYEFQSWDSQSKKPQYKNYLQWIKKNLKEGSPVIVTGYSNPSENEQYDHIFLAIGAHSASFEEYDDEDSLIYTDHFDEDYIVTKFGKIWDTRQMQGNGKDLDFAFPRDLNYGVAIKGIKDPNHLFLPIRLTLEENSEPNVSVGQNPTTFEVQITVSDLEQGKKYVLLRYNDWKNIPVDQVVEAKADKVTRFVAEGPTYNEKTEIQSNSGAFFRCVEEQNVK